MKSHYILITFALILFILGCETYNQDDYVEQYVIESILTAGEPFPPVKLSTTLPIEQTYSFDAAAVQNASVIIQKLDHNNNVIEEILFEESEDRGIYIPIDEEIIVEAGFRYKLDITNLPHDDERITSTTFVPEQPEFIETNTLEAFYQGDVQFEVTFFPGSYPGRQNVFVATSLALDPINFGLTPFWEGIDGEPFEFERVSSGLVNEGNYDLNPDGSVTLKYPWIGIAYYGPNELSVYTVDTNYFDYRRSLDVQTGGANVSPGQIENVLWNVEGGIGLFASRSGISIEVMILNPFE